MGLLTLTKNDFNSWANTTYIGYASDTVEGKRRRFEVNLNSAFKVLYGGKCIYEGYDIVAALSAFNNIGGNKL
jgi:hypothetical protein